VAVEAIQAVPRAWEVADAAVLADVALLLALVTSGARRVTANRR
jgi:hypothetical protein